MTTAILGALKYLPASLGIKALEKISPKFKNYFSQVAAYGLDANRALEYIADQFRGESGLSPEATRPDIRAARTDVRNAQIPGKALRTAAAFGGAGLLFGGGEKGGTPTEPAQQPSRPEQPQGLSKKAIINQFLENFPEEEKPTAVKPGQGQRIANEFPGLLQFLQRKLSEGNDLQKASELAYKSKLHGPVARKVEQDTGMTLTDWAASQLGGQGTTSGTTGLQNLGQLGAGISDSFYSAVLNSLKSGKSTVSGVKDPFLTFAKPFYDQGQVKGTDDLRNLYSQYSQQRKQGQQGQSPVKGEILQLVGRGNQLLDQILRGRNG